MSRYRHLGRGRRMSCGGLMFMERATTLAGRPFHVVRDCTGIVIPVIYLTHRTNQEHIAAASTTVIATMPR